MSSKLPTEENKVRVKVKVKVRVRVKGLGLRVKLRVWVSRVRVRVKGQVCGLRLRFRFRLHLCPLPFLSGLILFCLILRFACRFVCGGRLSFCCRFFVLFWSIYSCPNQNKAISKSLMILASL